jgi:hypothetical protein
MCLQVLGLGGETHVAQHHAADLKCSACSTRVTWGYMLASGRLSCLAQTCSAAAGAQWHCLLCPQGAFDAYAMGNFPYPSSYINGDPAHPLPAWPMHAACQAMTKVG